MILLAGLWFLNSCASEPIELARGTHWREAAKVAGEPEVKFSYQINGRKYDRVTFAHVPQFSVMLEDGRVFSAVDYQGDHEWDRRFKECINAGDLPFEKGLGPLHSLVMEQGRRFQREGWPKEPDHTWTAGQVALIPIGLALAPIGIPFAVAMVLVPLPIEAASKRSAKEVNNALLDSGTSYANFLARIGKPDLKTSKGSYSADIYWPVEGFTKSDHHYEVGVRNGRVVWVAYKNIEVLRKINVGE